jgi:UDP-glucose 4-epimerase
VGDGSDTKHFVYVGDLARANCMALESDVTDVTVNTSGPEPITTAALVRLVAELAGRPDLEPEMVAPDAGKVRLTAGGAFRIDHTAAKTAIGWQPEIDMREGLRRLLAWRDRPITAS